MDITDIKYLHRYSVRTLVEWYTIKIASQTLEESRQDTLTLAIQKEIENRLKAYEEDADKYGNKRKSDRLIVGEKK